ncbi:MAG: sodium:alanine symporter family protein [Ruminococcaceae bacterium]|nr:sodium:alanine symporter family protein [Oscillospiraceae bacterium]
MERFFELLAKINGSVNDLIWVKVGIALLFGAGIVMTFATGFFQITHIGHWFKSTIGSIFKKDSDATKKDGKKTVSQFQALCTALGATIGTGNVAGVSAAIVLGGPGAVFWMWIAAFFGMMTKFSEITLGIYFRRKNKDGEWSGGAMYFLRDGFGSYKGCKTLGRVLAWLFAAFTAVAAFGIGNMGQVNKITINLKEAVFRNADLGSIGSVPVLNIVIGAVLMVLGGLIILGGIQRIASFAEKVVPFMAIFYFLGALILFFINIDKAGDVFASIFRFAFNNEALAGGAAGAVISKIVAQGCKRGMFSNEAGLGSSVMVHSSADVREPVKQGMWGIFEVFVDTFVVCTATAFVVLSSGLIDLERGVALEGVSDATLVSRAFGQSFGIFGEIFVAVAIFLFAFTTVVGWSQYGAKAVEYLMGTRAVKVYQIVFVVAIIFGAVMESSLAWDISDTFNGFMMIPNLIGVISLTPLVIKLVKNYIDRNLRGKKDVVPMLSYDPALQREMEKELAEKK